MNPIRSVSRCSGPPPRANRQKLRNAELLPHSPSRYVMSMPLAVPHYTLQDLESFPDDGYRYELVDGLLLVTPGPAPLHEEIIHRLVERLTTYLAGSGARLYTRGTVEREPATHLEPDILVVPKVSRPQRITAETKWTEFGRPWLVVEVSGKGSRVYDRDYKLPAYLALEAHEVWRIDLQEGCAFAARQGQPLERRAEYLAWHPPGLQEPLVVSIASLFEGTYA